MLKLFGEVGVVNDVKILRNITKTVFWALLKEVSNDV